MRSSPSAASSLLASSLQGRQGLPVHLQEAGSAGKPTARGEPHRVLFVNLGTMVGCLLLLLAMVDVVQIKLGRLSCYSKLTFTTVCLMVGIIGP
ncbi:uncharacterized protein J3R85_015213 [Psidium guajava]|nr:uncharacterized protein J3R85_015213 [Psidium guajava]